MISPPPLPPETRVKISVQTEDFDVSQEIAALRGKDGRVGAVALFLGTVRDFTDTRELDAPASVPKSSHHTAATMTLEHYPGMTEQALEKIARNTFTRFSILGMTVIHRVGVLKPTDPIVLVAVTSAHRHEAFSACEMVMDFLKTEAPFWKKEETPEGARWVEARSADEAAKNRWITS